MAQNIAKEGVFDAKNHEESIGHDFKALSRAILPEIDDLCKLPSELRTEKRPITTLLHPLTHKNLGLKPLSFSKMTVYPLLVTGRTPPPLFLPLAASWPPVWGEKSPFYDQKKVRFDLIRNR